MAKTVADPHVLQATNQPNMLNNLQEANELLDEIMKKRLQFYEAARRLDPKEIYDMIPITFPSANVLDRDLFPGVGKFDVEKALGENRPYFSLVSWVLRCQKCPSRT